MLRMAKVGLQTALDQRSLTLSIRPRTSALFTSLACATAALYLGGVQLIPEARTAPQDEKRGGPVVLVEAVTPTPAAAPRAAMLEQVRRNPGWLAEEGLRRYAENVESYTCTFWKQERIKGKLRDMEKIAVTYSEAPHSVFMRWQSGADQAKRVLWRNHPDYVSSSGEKLAKVEPNGAIVRLLVSEVEMPIHGARAKKASRAPIDQFGFRRALELFRADNARGESEGVLDLRYEGDGEVDGRPTFKLVRYLPFEGDGGPWPNAKLIMHVDQEWLLPTAVYGYTDRDGRNLLCSYVYTDITLNPDLDENAFKF